MLRPLIATTPHETTTALDWPAIKARTLAGIDVRKAFADLGLVFTGHVSGDKHECHARHRPVDDPSAFVNVKTGVYHSSGDGGESLHLFTFAVKYGDQGRWIDAVKHYAAQAGVTVGRPITKSGGRILIGHDDYLKADGSIHYRKFKYIKPSGKKTFTQHPPDGRGGWRWGDEVMKGYPRIPFHLPDIINRPGETIWWNEGEQAANAIRSLGLIGTTADNGSNATDFDLAQVAPYCAGRDVVVLPDNDDEGRKLAERVCRHLQGIARTVRRLDLPGLPLKGDVVEWLAGGGTAEELEVLADKSPQWTPRAAGEAEADADDPANRDCTLADLRITLSENAWIWPGWIPNSALTLLAAEGGIGKTRLLMDWHRRAYNGLPWPDGTWKPTVDRPKVLWVLADGQYEQICDTATAFGIPDDAIIINTMASDPQGGTELQTAEQLADLEARIRRVNPIWVNIDTITNTGDFKTQDSSDAKRQYKPLVEIAARCHVPIFCVTHLNASKKVLGRRAVEKVRVVIQLEEPDPNQVDRRKLNVTKSFAKKPAALGVTVSETGYEYDDKPPVEPEEGFAGKSSQKIVPARLHDCATWLDAHVGTGSVRVGVTIDDAEQAGFDRKLLYRARDHLGLIETINATTGGKSWSKPA